ncbi:MAG: hypothetical protein ABIG11_04645 [bacterium]
MKKFQAVIFLIIQTAFAASVETSSDTEKITPYGDGIYSFADPYRDTSVQDFVETSYGYMKGRQPAVDSREGAEEMRDAVGPVPSFGSFKPPVRAPYAQSPAGSAAIPARGQEQVTYVSTASASFSSVKTGVPASVSAVDKENMLLQFNPPDFGKISTVSVIKQSLLWSLKKAGHAGALAFAVPPVDFKSGYPAGLDYAFVTVEANGGDYAGIADRLYTDTGFRHIAKVFPVSFIKGEKNLLLGWVPASQLKTLCSHPLVSKMKTGNSRDTLTAPVRVDVVVTIKIPSSPIPVALLGEILARINESAGFIWKMTNGVSGMPLADARPDAPPCLMVKVQGDVPLDTAKRLYEHAFIASVETVGNAFLIPTDSKKTVSDSTRKEGLRPSEGAVSDRARKKDLWSTEGAVSDSTRKEGLDLRSHLNKPSGHR